MRVLIAPDAWHPQVNGVVRTLTSLAQTARALRVTVEFLTPEGFPGVPLPTYPGLRLALPRTRQIAQRIEAAKPYAIHIATEGPVGYMVRRYCRRHDRPFTTSYTTRFPEYISARAPIPEAWIYAALRRFHAAAAVTMVATQSLMTELGQRGFLNLGMWTRGVDTDLFSTCCAVQNLWLAARAEGVGVGWVSIIDNVALSKILELPASVVPVAYLCVGYPERFPDEPMLQTVGWQERIALDELVFEDRYGQRPLKKVGDRVRKAIV